MLKVTTKRFVGLLLSFVDRTICLTSSTPWSLISSKRSISDILGKTERSMVPLEMTIAWFVSRIETGTLSISVVLRRARYVVSSGTSICRHVLWVSLPEMFPAVFWPGRPDLVAWH